MEDIYDFADILQRFSPQVLWHFTGYNKPPDKAFEILQNIVKDKTLKISQRSTHIIMPSENKRWGYKSSCMCDIPFKDLWIHTRRYGEFGIAFHKASAILIGAFNPVLYVHKNHIWFKHVEKLSAELMALSLPHDEIKNKLDEFLTLLGTYVKSGDLLNKIHLDPSFDEEQTNNFYYEREWRSAYDYNFEPDHVVAFILPQKYIIKFKIALGDIFDEVPLISSDMIVNL